MIGQIIDESNTSVGSVFNELRNRLSNIQRAQELDTGFNYRVCLERIQNSIYKLTKPELIGSVKEFLFEIGIIKPLASGLVKQLEFSDFSFENNEIVLNPNYEANRQQDILDDISIELDFYEQELVKLEDHFSDIITPLRLYSTRLSASELGLFLFILLDDKLLKLPSKRKAEFARVINSIVKTRGSSNSSEHLNNQITDKHGKDVYDAIEVAFVDFKARFQKLKDKIK